MSANEMVRDQPERATAGFAKEGDVFASDLPFVSFVSFCFESALEALAARFFELPFSDLESFFFPIYNPFGITKFAATAATLRPDLRRAEGHLANKKRTTF